jgi:hypothetical protein
MFGNSYADNFGLPTLEWSGIDANPFYGGLGGAQAPLVMGGGQPVPGSPGPAIAGGFGGGPADPSVPALRSGSPLSKGPLDATGGSLRSSAPDGAQAQPPAGLDLAGVTQLLGRDSGVLDVQKLIAALKGGAGRAG